MPLSETVKKVRSGVFHVVCLNDAGERIASGSAFSAYGFLITNWHVVQVPDDSTVLVRREGDGSNQGYKIKGASFRTRQLSGSDKSNYDYSILEIPEVTNLESTYSFKIRKPDTYSVGDSVAFLGYPLEHQNLTCHAGIISSFYKSGPADVIQLDASVNASNSGGPLLDVESGDAIGIITRKATGLSGVFQSLRDSITKNIATVQKSMSGGVITLGGFNPNEGFIAGQAQILHTISEIERQANVGIGYAFSAKHLIDDNLIFDKI